MTLRSTVRHAGKGAHRAGHLEDIEGVKVVARDPAAGRRHRDANAQHIRPTQALVRRPRPRQIVRLEERQQLQPAKF